mmetsp:Transcript_102616/g.328819  ORF Transcript_102616/g.328819 Transcript_102616/m.328819 type:complete len:148 (+) Transcript_102616:1983-2426(+)
MGPMSAAMEPVAPLTIAGRPPRSVVRMQMMNEDMSPTAGVRPAEREKATASGTIARATVTPLMTSLSMSDGAKHVAWTAIEAPAKQPPALPDHLEASVPQASGGPSVVAPEVLRPNRTGLLALTAALMVALAVWWLCAGKAILSRKS